MFSGKRRSGTINYFPKKLDYTNTIKKCKKIEITKVKTRSMSQ